MSPRRRIGCRGQLGAGCQRWEMHRVGANARRGDLRRPQPRAAAGTLGSRRYRCRCPRSARDPLPGGRGWGWQAIQRRPPRRWRWLAPGGRRVLLLIPSHSPRRASRRLWRTIARAGPVARRRHLARPRHLRRRSSGVCVGVELAGRCPRSPGVRGFRPSSARASLVPQPRSPWQDSRLALRAAQATRAVETQQRIRQACACDRGFLPVLL